MYFLIYFFCDIFDQSVVFQPDFFLFITYFKKGGGSQVGNFFKIFLWRLSSDGTDLVDFYFHLPSSSYHSMKISSSLAQEMVVCFVDKKIFFVFVFLSQYVIHTNTCNTWVGTQVGK